MKCPKCNNSLALNEAEGHIGFICSRCSGIWLPTDYLDSLQHMHTFNARDFKVALANSRINTRQKESCPACNQLLAASIMNKIELDWCEKCGGVWFDRQELMKLVTHRSTQANAAESPVDFVIYMVEKFTDYYLESHPDKCLVHESDIDGYTPNHIPAKERIQNLIFSALLFLYGTYGVYVNDLYIPGKRSKGVHLHNSAAWVMYGAMVCACLIMLSIIVDHYDRRNNETNYRLFANIFKFTGWAFFVLSLILSIVRG